MRPSSVFEGICCFHLQGRRVCQASKCSSLLFAYSLMLKMDTICSFKMCVNFYQAIQHNVADYYTPHSHCSEKSPKDGSRPTSRVLHVLADTLQTMHNIQHNVGRLKWINQCHRPLENE
jgi:hypothetical protein